MLPDCRSISLEREEPIPVYIVTGFLGSGKTTLLRRLLSSKEFANSAVIINEFGSTSVDHLLLDHSQDLVEPIAGGCLCCLPRSRLVTSMFDFLQASYIDPSRQFSKLVIETSGLSDPLPIIQAFSSDPLRLSRFVLAKVITVVDATNFRESDFDDTTISSQISSSDVVVITKNDLANSFDEIEGIVRKYSRSRILNANILDISSISEGEFRSSSNFSSEAIEYAPDHLNSYFEAAKSFENPVPQDALSELVFRLRDSLGVDLLRLKGIVPLNECETQTEVHVSANGIVSFSTMKDRPRAPGEIVAIVRKTRKSDALHILEQFNSG